MLPGNNIVPNVQNTSSLHNITSRCLNERKSPKYGKTRPVAPIIPKPEKNLKIKSLIFVIYFY